MTKQFKTITFLLFVCILSANIDLNACTSAIISGRVTPDGRPILWKQRDTGAPENLIQYFTGGKYSFVGVVATKTKDPKSVWIGTNEKGFAIMNTLSYNILKDTSEVTGRNGSLMKHALENCATVDEFKQMLDTLPRPYRVSTNYGVIDAEGGAAYFEINNDEYFLYDVNDTKVAPLGYIVRTNFSFAGNTETGAGYLRYTQADNIVRAGVLQHDITPEYIFENLSRSFVNPLMGIDLKSGDFNKPKTNGWFAEIDFITRTKSTCSVVIQGVKGDEPADLTTMWTIIGYPPTTPAIPVWVACGADGISSLLTSNKEGLSTIAHKGYILKKSVYSFELEASKKDIYFNWELLYNLEGTGYMQKVQAIEHNVLNSYKKALEEWRRAGAVNKKELKKINQECDAYIEQRYLDEFSL